MIVPIKQSSLEVCLSGRKERTANASVGDEPARRFESYCLRSIYHYGGVSLIVQGSSLENYQ